MDRMPLPRVRSLAPLLIVAALLASACSSNREGASTATNRSADLLPTTPTQLPTFDLERFEQLLRQLRGRPVLANIWASWCGPCTVEAPHLAAAAKAYRGRVQFLGVDILDQTAPAREFVKRYGWIYPSVFDPNGSIRDGLGFVGQPITILYDAAGKQVFTWSGATTQKQLTTELEKVV